MGLSPQELGSINAQQIQRDQNVLDLLGTASKIKRDRSLIKQTEAQTAQLEPVEIETGGKKFQTTRGNMVNAMQTLQQIQSSKAQTARTEYENEPMQISINGEMFNLRRHEFKDMSQILADQERLGIQQDEEGRAGQKQVWKADAIKMLSEGKEVTPEIIAKLGGLPGTPSTAAGRVENERLQQVRKDWNQIYVEMNKPPKAGAKNPMALASSANAMAEELGEPIAAVVFSEGYEIPGLALFGGSGKDIPKGMIKMKDLRNPQTGALMSIGEVRKQAAADGMTLNDALKILYIQRRLKEVE